MSGILPEKYEKYRAESNLGFSETYKKLAAENPIIHLGFIIGALGLLFAGFNEICFNLRYTNPSVTGYTQEQINIYQEPVQTEPSSTKPFVFYSKSKDEYNIIPMADYSISAMVVAKNTNLWLRGIMNSYFDNVALIDLGLLCGDVAELETLKYVRFQSKKILSSARELRPIPTFGNSWREVNDYFESKNLSLDYFSSHMSHVHIIPANDNIMSALMRLKIKDSIKLDGYLVDLYYDGQFSRTSLSRSDTNPTSRGNGACEVMYVSRVQIGNKIYQ